MELICVKEVAYQCAKGCLKRLTYAVGLYCAFCFMGLLFCCLVERSSIALDGKINSLDACPQHGSRLAESARETPVCHPVVYRVGTLVSSFELPDRVGLILVLGRCHWREGQKAKARCVGLERFLADSYELINMSELQHVSGQQSKKAANHCCVLHCTVGNKQLATH